MAPKVEARFYVARASRVANAPDSIEVELSAVTRGGNDELAKWSEATPSGSIKMTISNPAAAAVFLDAVGSDFRIVMERLPVGWDATEAGYSQHVGQAYQRTNLAECDEYVPSEYEREHPDRSGPHRCARCNCKPQSHEEPLRSVLIRQMGLQSMPVEP